MKRINDYFEKKENKQKVPDKTEEEYNDHEYDVDNPSGKYY